MNNKRIKMRHNQWQSILTIKFLFITCISYPPLFSEKSLIHDWSDSIFSKSINNSIQ